MKFYDADGCEVQPAQIPDDPYPSWIRFNDCPALIAAGSEIEHCNDEIVFVERPDVKKVQIMLDFWDRQAEYRLEAVVGERVIQNVIEART